MHWKAKKNLYNTAENTKSSFQHFRGKRRKNIAMIWCYQRTTPLTTTYLLEDMQGHQGVVTRAKEKQLKSHKDQIEQEKFQWLNFNVQDFTGQYAKVLNKNRSYRNESMVDRGLMYREDIVYIDMDRKNGDGDLVSKLYGYGGSLVVMRNLDSQSLGVPIHQKKRLFHTRIPLQHVCTLTSVIGKKHTMEFDDQGSNGFEDSLISFIGDLCDKFQGEFVEKCAFLLLPLDPYMMGFVEHIHMDKPLLLVNGLFENSCHWYKFLMEEKSFKTLLENAFGFNFFYLHYKNFLLLKDFENEMGCCFKMSETNFCELLETIMEFLWIVACAYLYPLRKDTFQTIGLLELLLEFENDESFYFHLPFKDVGNDSSLEELSREWFLRSFISKLLSKPFEGTLLI
ncbi:hypothetical protein M9H77_12568 [Catharanthus roseus]|uniref:Uncharacterized protein n=1 Tax=Catharanthus roseus TaxID=4058 RepID=A0ACC0BHZ1_CATRO|nr:hypothetical protein M9H77_12568 [Catharanthus roseus]